MTGRKLLAPISILLAVSLAGSIALFAPTTKDGFFFDDYHQVRPYSAREVVASFWGPWDPAHIELPYYRPLTVAFNALRFWFFHFHAGYYHWLSIALFAVAGTLLGTFLFRLFRSMPLALTGLLIFLVYPAMPDTLVAWITNQMHLLQVIVFLLALNWWVTCKDRAFVWWLPIALLEIVAFLLKEDGIMLVFVILLLQGIAPLRRRNIRAVWPVLLLCLGTVGGLVLLRSLALGGTLGGRSLPSLHVALENARQGPRLILLGEFGDHGARWLNTLFVVGVGIAGAALAVVKRDRIAGFLLLLGIGTILCFNLPYFLATKFYQYHLLALGGVFLLLGSILVLHRAAKRVAIRWAVVQIGAAAVVGVTVVALIIGRPQLQSSYAPDADGFAPLQAEGFYDVQEDDAHNRYAWTQGRATFSFAFLPRKPITVTLKLRSAAVAGGPDAPVSVVANGQSIATLRPDPRNANFQSFDLRFVPAARDDGQLRVVLDVPTFAPKGDARTLGTMIAGISIDKREAWSGIGRRLWLVWLLSLFAVAAAALRWMATRADSPLPAVGAMAAALLGMGDAALLLFLLWRMGEIDSSRYPLWVGGCALLVILFGVAALAALAALPTRADRWPVLTDARRRLHAAITHPSLDLVFAIFVLCAALNMAHLSRQHIAAWSPDSPRTLRYDREALGWGANVPEELRRVLQKKLAAQDS